MAQMAQYHFPDQFKPKFYDVGPLKLLKANLYEHNILN